MSQIETTKKFSLGRIMATPGALNALHAAGQSADEFLARHVTGDWGDLDAEENADRQDRQDHRAISPDDLPGAESDDSVG